MSTANGNVIWIKACQDNVDKENKSDTFFSKIWFILEKLHVIHFICNQWLIFGCLAASKNKRNEYARFTLYDFHTKGKKNPSLIRLKKGNLIKSCIWFLLRAFLISISGANQYVSAINTKMANEYMYKFSPIFNAFSFLLPLFRCQTAKYEFLYATIVSIGM